MKQMLKSFLVAIIIFIMIAYSNISWAETLNDLKDERSDVSEQIQDTKNDLEDIDTEKSETLEQVENLIGEISKYQNEIDDLQGKLDSLKSDISELEVKIKADETEYNKENKALDKRLVAMYKTGETSYLDFLLSSTSLMDFISSYYLISQVVDYDEKMLVRLDEHKQKIEKEKESLEASKKEVETTQITLTAKQNALQVSKKEKEKYVDQLSEQEKEKEKKLQELQDTNDELDKKIKAKQAEIAAAKARAAQNQNHSSGGASGSRSASASTTTSSYGLIWPTLTRYSVTTGWYYSTGKLHGASDISGAGIYGAPIFAAADGYVVTSTAKVNSAGQYISYGNYVFIAHYNGLYTLYGHMSQRVAREGQEVKQGQIIGYVGSTGNSTGPHLHFEVRTGSGSYSERVNPLNGYLPTK